MCDVASMRARSRSSDRVAACIAEAMEALTLKARTAKTDIAMTTSTSVYPDHSPPRLRN